MARGFERQRHTRALGLATIGAAVATGPPASADIVSSGVVNFETDFTESVPIDLDGDGTFDYTFQGNNKHSIYLNAWPTATFAGGPSRLPAGELIGDGLTYSSHGAQGYMHGAGGEWNGAFPVTGYVGAGFMIDSQLHYGWIEYTAISSQSGTIVQWAYDDIPGTPIEAGDTGICPADIDGDGEVGINDLLALLSQWGPCPVSCAEDIDQDGQVGISDLLLLLAQWGACP